MTTKERILLENKAWREEKLSTDAHYFGRVKAMNAPRLLWITSSDSLIPIQEMTNTEPGDVLVHRNLAIQIRPDDISFVAVLEEALSKYEVKHIMICAYSHCSGVSDVVNGVNHPPAIKHWLSGLRALYEQHHDELKGLSIKEQEKRLSEINIRQQVINLSKMELIQRYWERQDYPKIIGWYFDLGSGFLQEVFSLEKNHRIKQVSSLSHTVQQ
jgi:carbonic anhydrase